MLRPDSRAFRRGSSEVEHALGKGGVGGSIPPRGTIMSAAGGTADVLAAWPDSPLVARLGLMSFRSLELRTHVNLSKSALASLRSGVSKPSVNQS